MEALAGYHIHYFQLLLFDYIKMLKNFSHTAAGPTFSSRFFSFFSERILGVGKSRPLRHSPRHVKYATAANRYSHAMS